MKRVCLILCLMPLIGWAQVKDDFSDGNFTESPEWVGDTAHFEVNAAKQLHLYSSGTDTSVLITRNIRMLNTEWDFWVKLSFNTSANNYARVYLISDSENLQTASALFLQLGGSDDSITLIKQTNQNSQVLYTFKAFTTSHSTNTMRFKFTCDDIGNWIIRIDTTGGFNYIQDGAFKEKPAFQPQWTGVYCRYTSSNASKIWFDDFYAGPIIRDTIPPKVVSQAFTNGQTIRLTFSEAMLQPQAVNPANYTLQLMGTPDSARFDMNDNTTILLHFSESIAEGATDTLSVHGLQDLAGNMLRDTLVPVFYYTPQAYDVLFTEIMADPEPQVELPTCEYAELFNNTNYPVNLEGWTIRYGSNSKVFPVVTLAAHGFLIISKDSVFSHYGQCIPLFTSSTSLSNEGTTLVLLNEKNHVIHSVSYHPDWFGGSFKEDGGWSLEMVDPSNPCGCEENWTASNHFAGGTPGQVNSVIRSNPDITEPKIMRVYISDSATLDVRFSEAMDSAALVSTNHWIVQPLETVHPDRVEPIAPKYDLVKLHFGDPFTTGVLYGLHPTGIMYDCSGNQLDTIIGVNFAIPDSIGERDIVINEILADPATGGSRFAELYNRSDKIVDLRSVVISRGDSAGAMLEDAEPLTSEGYLFFPGEYVAFTPDPLEIIARYRPAVPEKIVIMERFPVLGNDSGTVIIARKDNLAIIDQVRYSSLMHYPLLATSEGVSLERASSELPSNDAGNWHSAAETFGFATPGYLNSQRLGFSDDDLEVSLTPEIFSPDNDGFDDLLNITLRESDPGFSANLIIYDSKGRLIRQIANQVFTGSEGIFIWDGTTAKNTKAAIGIYILLVEITKPDGTVRKIKKTTVLGGRISN